MTTDLIPPTPAPAGPPPLPPEQRRGSARVVAIIAIVVGGALILSAILSAVGSALWMTGARGADGPRVADAGGISSLSLDVSAGDVAVVYADVEEATLDVLGDGRGWRLERQGDQLRLSKHEPWWISWNGFDWNSDRVTLTLPQELADERLDARIDVSAGSVSIDGTYGDLDVHIGAGSADVNGTADVLSVDLSAGGADIDVADVSRGTLTVGAGELIASLTGTAPDELTIDVSAGSLVASLPDDTYAVTSDVSAGELDNQLSTSSDAPHRIDVQVSAGSTTLRPTR
ncbi:hypothetical protein AB3M83_04050 [Microbacterium sp. 179-B 1A2 NHS]|uniref:hypothetical protein n=1 Tax=Microbacterium sp. 179-B 1A2 NHS TaxID=3142383 RepID=UPI0039A085FF